MKLSSFPSDAQTVGRSNSVPSMRPAPLPGRTEDGGRVMWTAARGSGGFHYRLVDDWDLRHEYMEEKKWAKTNALKPPAWNETFLHHMTDVKNYDGHDARLKNYIINGQLYSQGVWPSPPPEQAKRCHWLCQVNGNTNEYNIITGRSMNPHNLKYRREEVDRFRATAGAGARSAGEIQPQKDVACYDIQGFVPVYKHNLMGNAARNSSLSFLK